MGKNGKGTALQKAVNSFLDVIKEKSPNSRVAIVSYSDSSSIDSGSKTAETALVPIKVGENVNPNLTNAVSKLKWDGGTYVENGMEDAVDIFQAVPSDDANYNNKRVTILFTDGVPGGQDYRFTVHVLKPTIKATDIWANYGTNIPLEP